MYRDTNKPCTLKKYMRKKTKQQMPWLEPLKDVVKHFS